jgi:hypothetical protein
MNKKILFLTGILVAGAVAVIAFDKSKQRAPDPRLGKPLVAADTLAGVDSITIVKDPVTTKLVLDPDKVWRIGDEKGFPADAARVTRLLDDLAQTEAQVLASSAREAMNEYGFDTAVRVTLTGAGKELLVANLGANRERGGQYVSFGGEFKAYLISQSLTVLPDADHWEMKALVDIKADQVKRVAFEPPPASGKKPVVLMREKAEDPIAPESVPDGQKPAGSIRSHESILASVTFAKRVDPGNEEYKSAMAHPAVVNVTLFDGRVYTVKAGSVGDTNKKYFLQMQATKGESTSESNAKNLAMLNELMAMYAFEVPAHVGSKFEKGFDDMFDKKGS